LGGDAPRIKKARKAGKARYSIAPANVNKCSPTRGLKYPRSGTVESVKTVQKRRFMVSITAIITTVRSKKRVFANFSGVQGSFMPAFLPRK
jgi:hypothetical protein